MSRELERRGLEPGDLFKTLGGASVGVVLANRGRILGNEWVDVWYGGKIWPACVIELERLA